MYSSCTPQASYAIGSVTLLSWIESPASARTSSVWRRRTSFIFETWQARSSHALLEVKDLAQKILYEHGADEAEAAVDGGMHLLPPPPVL